MRPRCCRSTATSSMPVGPNSDASTSNNAVTRLKLVAATTIRAFALAALALVVLLFVSARDGETRREAQRAGDRTRLHADRELRGRRQRRRATISSRPAPTWTTRRTCGGFSTSRSPAGPARSVPTKDQQKLRAGCTDGNFADCDELWLLVGARFRRRGPSARRAEAAPTGRTQERARQTNGGAEPAALHVGDDPTLDGLWTKCEAGDGGACDELYSESPSGSDYENFGLTCG